MMYDCCCKLRVLGCEYDGPNILQCYSSFAGRAISCLGTGSFILMMVVVVVVHKIQHGLSLVGWYR